MVRDATPYRTATEHFPKLRSDLEVLWSRNVEGEEIAILRDPTSGKVFEFGKDELALCELFDGVSDFDQIGEKVRVQLEREIALEDIAAFAKFLDDEGLLAGGESDQPPHDPGLSSNTAKAQTQFSLGNPDKAFHLLARKLRWCASTPVLILSACFVFAAAAILTVHWTTWTTRLAAYWNPLMPLLILLVFIFLVTGLKEVARGIAMSFFGMHVPKIGLALRLYLFPRIYIDLRQYQFITDKSHRLWINFISGYIILLLWAIGIIGWKLTKLGTYPNLLYWILSLVSAIWSIFFIWNPLRSSEAYQLLSTWLGIPRLQPRAMRVAKAWAFSKTMPEPLSKKERRGFIWYGVLSALWLVAVLSLVALFLWQWLTGHYAGSGAIVFTLLILYVVTKFRSRSKTERESIANTGAPSSTKQKRTRPVFKWAFLAACLLAILYPIPYRVSGEFQLYPHARVLITSEIDGVLEKVNVHEGDVVQAGSVVAKLVDRDYLRNVKISQASLLEEEAELSLLLGGTKPEKIAEAEQSVEEKRVSLEYSEAKLSRIKPLRAKGIASEQQFEDAKAARDLRREELSTAQAHLELLKSDAREEEIAAAEARVNRLRTQYEYTQERLEKTRLTTSISGKITTPRIHEQVGKRLEPGDEVGEVENTSVMQAEVLLREEDVRLIDTGSTSTLSLWSYPEDAFQGIVKNIVPIVAISVDAETKVVSNMVRVIVEVPNMEGRLRSGATGYAKFYVGEKPLLWVITRRIVDWARVELWSWLPF